MSELAYSLHLGSDRNKRYNARTKAKSNASGSTSLSNNAIQNARGLSRVDKHNYRKYDNGQELIKVIRGTNSLYDDVKRLYKKEFEEHPVITKVSNITNITPYIFFIKISFIIKLFLFVL